ncbi:sulfate ABC transporter ATP-binding protein, partial [Mesorhizobium sp. M00.F.Ca.ET.186.01.1.1]
PHDAEVSLYPPKSAAATAVQAHIERITLLGPLVRLELRRLDTKEVFEAEMGRQRFLELLVEEGDVVYVTLNNLSIYVESGLQSVPTPALAPVHVTV